MRVIKQSQTATVVVLLVDSTDHVTGKTGVSFTNASITLSKNGSSFAVRNSLTTLPTALGYGWYAIPLGADDTNLVGDLVLHVTGASCDDTDRVLIVESATNTDLATATTAISTKTVNLPTTPAAVSDIPTAATVAATVETTLTTSHGSGSWQTGSGGGGGTGTAPTVDEIDAKLTASHGTGSWVTGATMGVSGPSGSGSLVTKIVVTDESGNPLDGVSAWVSSDLEGNHVVAGALYTNSLGVVTFILDTGTFYLWRQRSGINFNNPTQFTVMA